MSITAALLPEFDTEMTKTRKALERVPDDKLGWKPHQKSWTMGQLATHVANIPGWAVYGIGQDSLDLAPGGVPVPQPKLAGSRSELLALFDKNAAAGHAALAGATDEHLFKPWSLLRNGQTLMSVPRTAVLRNFVLSHIIHHRAQLGVYLRMNDIPVPATYGPSADESPF